MIVDTTRHVSWLYLCCILCMRWQLMQLAKLVGITSTVYTAWDDSWCNLPCLSALPLLYTLHELGQPKWSLNIIISPCSSFSGFAFSVQYSDMVVKLHIKIFAITANEHHSLASAPLVNSADNYYYAKSAINIVCIYRFNDSLVISCKIDQTQAYWRIQYCH